MVLGSETIFRAMEYWKENPRVRLIPLFRAFVMAWTGTSPVPLEDQIFLLSEERTLKTDSLIFKNQNENCKAIFIVPRIHPGPFRDVGGGNLPNLILDQVQVKTGCNTIVAHGISTHMKDLTRSIEVVKIVESIIESLLCNNLTSEATHPIIVRENEAQVTCQLFGDSAFITISLSPLSYDDIPEWVGDAIEKEAEALGIRALVVDSHNSINLKKELDDYDPDIIIKATTKALRKAMSQERYPFEASIVRVIPEEWGLEEGMGPGGISVLMIKLIDGQSMAYVVVDSNNMITGLRERVVATLEKSLVDDAEIMTSDVHIVNAIGATDRGYSPMGEKISHEKLVEYITNAVKMAISELEKCRVQHTRVFTSGLNILGERGLEALKHILESGFAHFTRIGVVVSSISIILTFLILFVL
jgi:putative membrane protein